MNENESPRGILRNSGPGFAGSPTSLRVGPADLLPAGSGRRRRRCASLSAAALCRVVVQ